MSIGVLLSIRPKWCKLIASGEKTIEVRKTRPTKVKTPFKCYIYCTEQRSREDAFNIPITSEELQRDMAKNGMKCMSKYGNGRVWAEFTCDTILPMTFSCSDPEALTTHYMVPGTGLADVEIMEYLGNGKPGYGLHIRDLKIYDKPKELEEFTETCKSYDIGDCWDCENAVGEESDCGVNKKLVITYPPQGWRYVNTLKEEKNGDSREPLPEM